MRTLLVLTGLLASVLTPAVYAQDAEVLYQGAGETLAVEDLARIEFQEIGGKVTVRGGKNAEVRFMCRALEDRNTERELIVIKEGRKLILRAADPTTAGNLLLEVAVPSGVAVSVDMNDSNLYSHNLYGPLKIKGQRLNVEGRGLKRSVDVEVAEGSVNLQGVEGDLNIDGKDIELNLLQVTGDLGLTLERSNASVTEVHGAADVDLGESGLTLQSVGGEVRVNGREGTLHLGGLMQGAIVRISRIPMSLAATRGPIEIYTDTEVAFSEHDGNLRVEGYGAGLSGSGITGSLLVASGEASVVAENIEGDARVQGDELEIDLRQLKSDLTLEVTSSVVTVDGVEGKLKVKSEYGDLVIHGVAKELEMASREDMVTVSGQKGPFTIKANGPRVTVHVAELAHEDNCMVENKGGDVLMLLSEDVGVRIEADAAYGRIESGFDDIVVDDSENRAEGNLDEVEEPIIGLVSGANIYINPGELAGPHD